MHSSPAIQSSSLAALMKDIPFSPAAPDTSWVQKPEQEQINAILAGQDVGHYYLIMGEKGAGKTIMLLEGMRRLDGDGISMFEAHADLEIFRVRLGKALDHEFSRGLYRRLFQRTRTA